MSRLADYFIVVGYDHDKDRNGISAGKVIQRFPEQDWDNCVYTQGIELFCQPAGWQLHTQRLPPSYFVSVLTDIDGNRHYCACLTFMEDVNSTAVTQGTDDATEEKSAGQCVTIPTPEGMARHSCMFAPKSLVLVSQLDYFETFRHCLGLIYTVYIDNQQTQIETLIGNILGCIQVPPPGGPQIRFSIGAGDRQSLQPPLSNTLPTTRTSVIQLFRALGITNSLRIFCAALSDHKVLFHSESFLRLTDASHALTALLYPLKYSYVYIPLLPSALFEVLSTPTPFIAGIHSSLKHNFDQLPLDVIVADLDGGTIHIPQHITLALMPEPMQSRVLKALYMILLPDLVHADFAFQPSLSKKRDDEILDKEIRAVFIRFFAELFFGYRSCLNIIRIHPEPFITFHKANFLGQRGLVDDDFATRVLDSMCFSTFVADRGPPYRICDLYDEVFASMHDTLESEVNDECMMKNIKELAQQLLTNENPNPQPYIQKIPLPTEGSFRRIHQPTFPYLDWMHIQEIIDEGLAKHSIKNKYYPYSLSEQVWYPDKERISQMRPLQPRIVPMGHHISSSNIKYASLGNSFRRLEVLRNCVMFIFDNKISDARKIFPAVLRAMKSKVSRLALVEALKLNVQSNKAMLEHQQFDMVVKLLNCALQNDSSMDENGVAAEILPLSTVFCRKLSTGVIQFAYTEIQEHAVWANQQFWEATFYQDVQLQIRQLYAPQYEEQLQLGPSKISPTEETDRRKFGENLRVNSSDSWRRSPSAQRRHNQIATSVKQISALEIAAEQMRVWPDLSEPAQTELVNNEEAIVYSQAIHYANRMVYLRVPLDATKSNKDSQHHGDLGESNSSNVTNSVAESDSFDAESGFDETEVSEVGPNVVKFVTRFVDKVCQDSSVTAEHIQALHLMVPGVVSMHIDTLDLVFQESKCLPPIQKPKLLSPVLLPGEETLMDGLRVYLVADGREEATSVNLGGPQLLPAEGALFLTNYRLVFKGTPCDPLACEQVVSRSFPVSTLTREKKINVLYLNHIEHWLQECIQLRSHMFQLMKLAFDEEVSSEDVDVLRKLLNKVRHPPSVISTFAFTNYMHPMHTTTREMKNKHKNASLKGFAKRTFMKTARKAGIKTKEASPVKKYGIPTPPPTRRDPSATLPANMDQRPSSMSLDDDELSVIDELEIQNDAKTVDRIAERAYCRDYTRLGFGSLTSGLASLTKHKTEAFRLSMVNSGHGLCRSYPSVLVVPQNTSDSSIRKFARCHRQNRFPVVTWRHPTTKAVLLRGSGFHTKSVMNMIKSHHHNTSTTSGSIETSASLEHENYFQSVIRATPLGCNSFSPSQFSSRLPPGVGSHYPPGSSTTGSPTDSLSSLDSLMLEAEAQKQQNPLTRVMKNTLRNSGGKAKFYSTLPRGFVWHNPTSASSATPLKRTTLRSTITLGRLGGSSLRGTNRFSTPGYTPPSAIPSNKQTQRYSCAGTPYNGSDLSTSLSSGSGSCIGAGGISPQAQNLHRSALYVLGDKNQMKGVKADAFAKCDFIPVECTDVKFVKSSFKKLMRACVPSSAYPEDKGYLKQIEESGWLPQLQNILRIAGAAVDLLDAQGSSVMLCLEDGWDFTTQVISIAQLLLDPYYRTIEGFKVLIEKEWLSFGHRFTHRSNQTAANITTGFAPIFLQFLDVVHQVVTQFPMSFEFNQYFIKFLAYHYVSNRFRTFMLDNEYERVELGWLLDEKPSGTLRSPINESDSEADVSPHRSFIHNLSSHSTHAPTLSQGYSIWDYIDKYHKRSPVFYNYYYTPIEQDTVLRPYSNLANLVIWDYYTQEDLAHGPSYDFESVSKEMREMEEQQLAVNEIGTVGLDMSQQMKRTIVNGCYDDVEHKIPESCTQLLLDIERLTAELGHLNYKWKSTWDKLEQPNRDQLIRQMSFNTRAVRSHGSSTHKRSTLELLVRGKLAGETAKMFSQAHHFERFTYNAPTNCDYCSHIIWSLTKTSGMRCSDCGYNVHDKCTSHVPKNCTRLLENVSDIGASNTTLSKVPGSETASVTGENRTHEGYLYKRGALLKAWKQRWFVFDSLKHQLRYYDSSDDSHCKGFIDMTDIITVNQLKNIQGAPKKTNENAAFELKTTRRIYHFLAPDLAAAQEWIDKIQGCIQ